MLMRIAYTVSIDEAWRKHLAIAITHIQKTVSHKHNVEPYLFFCFAYGSLFGILVKLDMPARRKPGIVLLMESQ